jgi:formylglycine-generating enzyme required for sulfatase activity
MKDKHKSSVRVFRGGSWFGVARYCRSAIRVDDPAVNRIDYLGFRLIMPKKEKENEG